MAFSIDVNPNLTYKQALTIAYEKAKAEGPLDDILVAECELVINAPEPDAVYHPSSFDRTGQIAPCGGTYQPVSNMYSIYEDAKLRSAKCCAASMADQMQQSFEMIRYPGTSAVPVALVVSSVGELAALQDGRMTDVGYIFKDALNLELSAMAVEYANAMCVLIAAGVEDRNAPYAKCFLFSE